MAIVKKHHARVKQCRRILPDVYGATFESLDKPFRYHSGQFLHLAMDPYDPTRPWPDSRCFSIQSPPTDDCRQLSLSFSVKGKFTQRMAEQLVEGRAVWLKMPYGDLFMPDFSGETCVFVAGGTGVTPFLSLFLHPAFARFARVALYLGVRSADYHVFAEELSQAQRMNPRFAVSVVDQQRDGLIPIDALQVKHGPTAVYFVSGPPVMIRAFRQRLMEQGVPEDHVRTDDWE